MFPAKYRGSFLFPESWNGRVKSVYSGAVNLLHPSGVLVSVVDGVDRMTDYAVAVEDFGLFRSLIYPGCKFKWKDGVFVFKTLEVETKNAAPWTGRISRDIQRLTAVPVSLKKAFAELAPHEGFSPVVTKIGGSMYSNAAAGILEASVADNAVSKANMVDLHPLVGMGIGFTPSGDDFITGAMLFETLSGRKLVNRDSIRANLSKTTEGGMTLLSLSLRNSFPAYLKKFTESLQRGEGSPYGLVKEVISHGATSGSDALSGFLWISELF